jgi:fumarate reductase subunit C
MLIGAIGRGASAYGQFLEWSARPTVLVVNVVTLFFVSFHAITWFNLAPKAMVVHVRGRRVPAVVIAASNYVALVVTSAIVAWLLLGT